MKYNKLIRDNMPEIILSKGGQPIYHTATEEEYWLKLKEKLLEESKEFNEAESIEELADVLEVIVAIREFKKFDPELVAKVKKEKCEKRGAFKNKLILDES